MSAKQDVPEWKKTLRCLGEAKIIHLFDRKDNAAKTRVQGLLNSMLQQIFVESKVDRATGFQWITSNSADIQKHYQELIVRESVTLDRYFRLPPEVAFPMLAQAFNDTLLWLKQQLIGVPRAIEVLDEMESTKSAAITFLMTMNAPSRS